jgi:hypothetical protein
MCLAVCWRCCRYMRTISCWQATEELQVNWFGLNVLAGCYVTQAGSGAVGLAVGRCSANNQERGVMQLDSNEHALQRSQQPACCSAHGMYY